MPLNHVEIDHILKEMDLTGACLQSIYQPTHAQIILHFFKRRPQSLLLSFAGEDTRLHQTWQKHVNTIKLQRFAQLLRSRLTGARITHIEQIENNRIVLTEFLKGGNVLRLWARLWSNQGNLILTDGQNKIIDCLFRKPAKGEFSGKLWEVPTAPLVGKTYTLRFREATDYSRQIESFYTNKSTKTKGTRGREVFHASLSKHLVTAQKNLAHLERENPAAKAVQWKHWGDLLLSYYPVLKGTNSVTLEDQEIPTEGIESVSELSALYFKRYKKTKETARFAEEKQKKLKANIAYIQAALRDLSADDWEITTFEETYRSLLKRVSPTPAKIPSRKFVVGLIFQSGDWQILIGRNAKENDLLLRKVVKSRDTWLHLRDFPGSYAFIRHRKDKTIPLDVLLDAANLALFYSQKRKLLRADLYYTQVKCLRRPKGGKLGLVIPTQEKNLAINLDEDRLKRLLENRENIEN